MQVALFGGSFDPPHVAHVLAAAYLLSTHPVDRVLIVPVYSHAFDKNLAPFPHRLEMCRLAMAFMQNVDVSGVEQTLGAPSRTLRTIEHLESEHPDWSLRLVVGADVVAETHKWFAFDEVSRRAPLIVLGRAGVKGPPAVLPEVSSTHVRDLLQKVDDASSANELDQVLPAAVREYIRSHGLYR